MDPSLITIIIAAGSALLGSLSTLFATRGKVRVDERTLYIKASQELSNDLRTTLDLLKEELRQSREIIEEQREALREKDQIIDTLHKLNARLETENDQWKSAYDECTDSSKLLNKQLDENKVEINKLRRKLEQKGLIDVDEHPEENYGKSSDAGR